MFRRAVRSNRNLASSLLLPVARISIPRARFRTRRRLGLSGRLPPLHCSLPCGMAQRMQNYPRHRSDALAFSHVCVDDRCSRHHVRLVDFSVNHVLASTILALRRMTADAACVHRGHTAVWLTKDIRVKCHAACARGVRDSRRFAALNACANCF
jgi:hypothetical protein